MRSNEQIDACVVVEAINEHRRTKQQRLLQQRCRQYFYRVSRHGNGFISLPALGEVFKAMYSIEDHKRRVAFLDLLCDLIDKSSIMFNSPLDRTYRLALEVRDFDSHIETADALRLAEAITVQATLITLDKKMVGNVRLQKKFGVRIKEPY